MAKKYNVVSHKKFTVKRAKALKHELEVLRDEMLKHVDSLDASYSIVKSAEKSRAAVLNASINVVNFMCDRSDIAYLKDGEPIDEYNNIYK